MGVACEVAIISAQGQGICSVFFEGACAVYCSVYCIVFGCFIYQGAVGVYCCLAAEVGCICCFFKVQDSVVYICLACIGMVFSSEKQGSGFIFIYFSGSGYAAFYCGYSASREVYYSVFVMDIASVYSCFIIFEFYEVVFVCYYCYGSFVIDGSAFAGLYYR